MPYSFYVGNNFVSAGDIMDYLNEYAQDKDNDKKRSTAPINQFMSNMKQMNIVSLGADVTLFNLGINIRHKKEHFLAIQLAARQRVAASFNLNKAFFDLIYKGNK